MALPGDHTIKNVDTRNDTEYRLAGASGNVGHANVRQENSRRVEGKYGQHLLNRYVVMRLLIKDTSTTRAAILSDFQNEIVDVVGGTFNTISALISGLFVGGRTNYQYFNGLYGQQIYPGNSTCYSATGGTGGGNGGGGTGGGSTGGGGGGSTGEKIIEAIAPNIFSKEWWKASAEAYVISLLVEQLEVWTDGQRAALVSRVDGINNFGDAFSEIPMLAVNTVGTALEIGTDTGALVGSTIGGVFKFLVPFSGSFFSSDAFREAGEDWDELLEGADGGCDGGVLKGTSAGSPESVIVQPYSLTSIKALHYYYFECNDWTANVRLAPGSDYNDASWTVEVNMGWHQQRNIRSTPLDSRTGLAMAEIMYDTTTEGVTRQEISHDGMGMYFEHRQDKNRHRWDDNWVGDPRTVIWDSSGLNDTAAATSDIRAAHRQGMLYPGSVSGCIEGYFSAGDYTNSMCFQPGDPMQIHLNSRLTMGRYYTVVENVVPGTTIADILNSTDEWKCIRHGTLLNGSDCKHSEEPPHA